MVRPGSYRVSIGREDDNARYLGSPGGETAAQRWPGMRPWLRYCRSEALGYSSEHDGPGCTTRDPPAAVSIQPGSIVEKPNNGIWLAEWAAPSVQRLNEWVEAAPSRANPQGLNLPSRGWQRQAAVDSSAGGRRGSRGCDEC